LNVNSRKVVVKGPRGTLVRSFKHCRVDISKVAKKRVKIEKWFGTKKEVAAVRTVSSHIKNMIKGVTKACSKKFPISCS
jgi:large subunit ribosomal protein L9e